MGLFGKSKETIGEASTLEKSDEAILKDELEGEVEKLQKEFRTRQEEIKEHDKKLQSVKEEYDSTVAELMELKKETNQKRLELDVVKREYKDIKEKIDNKDVTIQKNQKLIDELQKTETNIKNAKQELEKSIKEDKKFKEKISEEQSILHGIKMQEAQTQKELEEVTARLYNAKKELVMSDDGSVFSNKEKEFIQGQIGGKEESKGIIEAASVVAASLKSKLSMAEKELEAVQLLLEKERNEHMKTKDKLEKLQRK